jgi:hypothetical protein
MHHAPGGREATGGVDAERERAERDDGEVGERAGRRVQAGVGSGDEHQREAHAREAVGGDDAREEPDAAVREQHAALVREQVGVVRDSRLIIGRAARRADAVVEEELGAAGEADGAVVDARGLGDQHDPLVGHDRGPALVGQEREAGRVEADAGLDLLGCVAELPALDAGEGDRGCALVGLDLEGGELVEPPGVLAVAEDDGGGRGEEEGGPGQRDHRCARRRLSVVISCSRVMRSSTSIAPSSTRNSMR